MNNISTNLSMTHDPSLFKLKLPRVLVFDDGAIFEDELSNTTFPCLCLVCKTVAGSQMRTDVKLQRGLVNVFSELGPDSFIGIGAGDSGVSAHCFIGRLDGAVPNSTTLLHWDPHMQLLDSLATAVPRKSSSNLESSEPLRSKGGRLELVRKCLGRLTVDQMNNSFCVAFLLQNPDHWKQLKPKFSNTNTNDNGLSLWEVAQVLPCDPVKGMQDQNLNNLECSFPEDDF